MRRRFGGRSFRGRGRFRRGRVRRGRRGMSMRRGIRVGFRM